VTPVLLPAGATPLEQAASGGAAFAVLLGAALPLAVLAAVRMPAVLERVAGLSKSHPVRSAIAGAAFGLVVFFLLAGSAGRPAVLVAALALGAVLATLAFVGLAAESLSVGLALRGRDAGEGGPRGGAVALGWLVLAGIPLLPFAGALVALFLMLRGAGAAFLAATTARAEA